MIIISHGNPKRQKPDAKFECQWCGCIFIAEFGEYQKHDSQIQGDWVETHCPECGKRTNMRAEKSLSHCFVEIDGRELKKAIDRGINTERKR